MTNRKSSKPAISSTQQDGSNPTEPQVPQEQAEVQVQPPVQQHEAPQVEASSTQTKMDEPGSFDQVEPDDHDLTSYRAVTHAERGLEQISQASMIYGEMTADRLGQVFEQQTDNLAERLSAYLDPEVLVSVAYSKAIARVQSKGRPPFLQIPVAQFSPRPLMLPDTSNHLYPAVNTSAALLEEAPSS